MTPTRVQLSHQMELNVNSSKAMCTIRLIYWNFIRLESKMIENDFELRCKVLHRIPCSFSHNEFPSEWNIFLCLTTSRIIQQMCHFAILHAWLKFLLSLHFSRVKYAQEFNMLLGDNDSRHHLELLMTNAFWYHHQIMMKLNVHQKCY